MKKTLIMFVLSVNALFLLSFSFNAFAQTPLLDSTNRWTWDNTILGWANAPRTKNFYDACDNLTKFFSQRPLPDGSWENANQEIYTYDTNNNQTSEIFQRYDNGWVNCSQSFYTYDKNNNKTNELTQSWIFNEWVNGNNTDYIYDINNKCIKRINQFWNDSIWENVQEFTYTYLDDSNILVESQRSWYNDSIWINYSKYVCEYDVNGNRTSLLMQIGNIDTWDNYRQTFLMYDAYNKQIGMIDQIWELNEWVIFDKEEVTRTYDENGNQIKELIQSLNDGVMVNRIQHTWTYNLNNNLIADTLLSWKNDSIWGNGLYTTYTYDVNNNKIGEARNVWKYGEWMLYCEYLASYKENFKTGESHKFWDTIDITSAVDRGDSCTYYLHVPDVIINTESEYVAEVNDNISVYPNPNKGKFTIKNNINDFNIRIYNSNGKQVYSSFNERNKEMDLSDYAKGVYIIKFYNETQKFIKKIIII